MIKRWLTGNTGCKKGGLTRFFRMIFKGHGRLRAEAPIPSSVEAPEIRGTKYTVRDKSVQEYRPVPGQKGRDVEWAPCSRVVMKRMFEIAKVVPGDFLIDPGSGDGRIVISAAKLGAHALGIEYNHHMIELSRKNAVIEGVSDRAAFVQGDLFDADLSRATVLVLFLREDINLKLRPKFLEMRPGTRIVSNIFHMGEWEADEVFDVEDEHYYFRNHTVYFWVVPAKVGGAWESSLGGLELCQSFQMISGILSSNSTATPVEGRMTGEGISFTAGGKQYTGFVKEDVMEVHEEENGMRLTSLKFWRATEYTKRG